MEIEDAKVTINTYRFGKTLMYSSNVSKKRLKNHINWINQAYETLDGKRNFIDTFFAKRRIREDLKAQLSR